MGESIVVYVLWVWATAIPYTDVSFEQFRVPEWQTYTIQAPPGLEGGERELCALYAAHYIKQGFQAFCQKDHR